MRTVEIKEIANGFLVTINHPEINNAMMQAQYGKAPSNQLCFNTIGEVISYLEKVFPVKTLTK
jgi:hypothetical protein